jgi:hypothetical protein
MAAPPVADALVSDRRINNRVRYRAMAHESLKRPYERTSSDLLRCFNLIDRLIWLALHFWI